jgi:hypothetical protein
MGVIPPLGHAVLRRAGGGRRHRLARLLCLLLVDSLCSHVCLVLCAALSGCDVFWDRVTAIVGGARPVL